MCSNLCSITKLQNRVVCRKYSRQVSSVQRFVMYSVQQNSSFSKMSLERCHNFYCFSNGYLKRVCRILAEGAGFEPARGRTPTRFPGVRLKPLGHPSWRSADRTGRTITRSGGRDNVGSPFAGWSREPGQLSILSAARKASWGISTLPIWRMRFLPAFCFSRSFRFLETSPP